MKTQFSKNRTKVLFIKYLKLSLILKIVLFFTFILSNVNSYSQICSSTPSQIIDPSFENYSNGAWVDWHTSHGTPSIVNDPYTGVKAAWLWSHSDIGEGLFTCFDFDPTKCYDISFYSKVNDTSLSATFNLFATSAFSQSPNSNSTGVPNITSEQIASISYTNLSNNWQYTEIKQYRPTNNFNEFWMYPLYSAMSPSIQAEITIDELNINEVECDTCDLILATIDTCLNCVDSNIFYDFKHTIPSEYDTGQVYLMDSILEVTWGNFGNDTVSVFLDSLCPHDSITICFDLYIIDSWDGNSTSHGPDIFGFNTDGQSLLYATFSNSGYSQTFPNNYPANIGFNVPPNTGSIFKYGAIHAGYTKYEMCYTTIHTSSSILLDFFGSLSHGISNESWSIDNLSIQPHYTTGGSGGLIDLTVSGGTGSYTYLWSPNGETTQDLSGLPDGTYCVTVFDDNNPNCSATTCVTIACDTCSLIVIADTSCESECYAKVRFVRSPLYSTYGGYITGNPPFGLNVVTNNGASGYSNNYLSHNMMWSWNINNWVVMEDSILIDCNADSLTFWSDSLFLADTVQIYINNSLIYEAYYSGGLNGCNWCVSDWNYQHYGNGSWVGSQSFISGGFNYNQASVPVPYTGSPVWNNYYGQAAFMTYHNINNVTNTIASGGSIDLTVTGGSSNYSYSWTLNGIPYNSNASNLTGLLDGLYCVTVTDNNNPNCQETTCITIDCGCCDDLELSATDSCPYVNYIDLTVGCGTAPYTYLWSSGEVTEDIYTSSSGTYCVIVTDANGCRDTLCHTIDCCDLSLITHNTTAGTCNGSVIIPSGVIAPGYSFELSGSGSSYYLTAPSLGGAIGNLCSGLYVYCITDPNGVVICCESINIGSSLPSVILINTNVTHVSCFGDSSGSIDVSVTGGNPPYAYLWSTNDITEDLNNITAGNYNLTVNDAAGNILSISIVVTEPDLLNTIYYEYYDTVCASGPTSCIINPYGTPGGLDSIVGGTPPYTKLVDASQYPPNQLPSEPFLPGPLYLITTDANGCTDKYTMQMGSFYGCTNPIAINYNAGANVDDGSCITTTGFTSELVLEHLNVYPNPSGDVFNITFTSEQKQSITIGIINVIGERIYSENLSDFIGVYTKQINLMEHSKSIYFLEIKTSSGVIKKKLILQ